MLVSTLSLTGLLLWWSPGSTEPFLDADGEPLPGSIAEKVSVPINGVQQGMVIRGVDSANPVLLWVHGGPGMPDYPLTQQYPTELEDLFTVVWWDQRGAALSYHSDIPPETMTIEQFIDDTHSVTDYLCERFQQDRIYILGHSWGSFIAVQAAARSPERYRACANRRSLLRRGRSRGSSSHGNPAAPGPADGPLPPGLRSRGHR